MLLKHVWQILRCDANALIDHGDDRAGGLLIDL